MIIGIDVGNTNMTGALASDDGKRIATLRRKSDRAGGAKAGVKLISEIIAALQKRAAAKGGSVRRVGIGFGGPVDFERGVALLSHQNPGWANTPLRDQLQKRFDIPVALDNDANAGTLGEWRFGAGRGVNDLLYVNIGTGIGGGVIANGALVRGAQNLAGEIGHIIVRRDGPLCTCGKHGCLEGCASGSAIGRRGSEALGRKVSGKEVFALAAKGNATAQGVLDGVIEDLAQGLGVGIGLLNPALIIIGGGLSEAPEKLFLQPLRRAVPRYCLAEAAPRLRIEPAQLRYDAGVMGAVALAMS
ncbi:MAG: ROK family protein [Verrucomicrobiia bacterium]